MVGVVAAATVLLAACSSGSPVTAPGASRPSSWPVQAHRPMPSLEQAIRTAVDLGVAGPPTTISLNFSLRQRNPDGLKAVLASARVLTPAQYRAQFGPD